MTVDQVWDTLGRGETIDEDPECTWANVECPGGDACECRTHPAADDYRHPPRRPGHLRPLDHHGTGAMKPPKRINVGPFVYDVTFDRATMDARVREESTALIGHHDGAVLTIDIDPDQAVGQARDTLLHELLHAIADVTGLSEAWGDREEEFVGRLSPAILDTLRRNPKLVRYLIADD
jgi:hypothetical protein